MNVRGKVLIGVLALGGLSFGTYAVAQSNTVVEDKKEERIKIEIINGEKTVEIETIENGVSTIEVYKGEEAEEYLREHDELLGGKSKGHMHHFEIHEELEDSEKIIELMEESLEKLSIEMDEAKIVINGEEINIQDFDMDIDEMMKDLDIELDVNIEEILDEALNDHVTISKKCIIITDDEDEDDEDVSRGSSVKVFPNPSKGRVKIEVETSDEDPARIKVVDITGKEILDKTLSGNGTIVERINLDKEGAGTYIITVERNGEVSKEKVIIE